METEDGTTEGYLRLGGGDGAPWLNHTKVYFVSSEDWPENGRPKRKIVEEFTAEDILSYHTVTQDRYEQEVPLEYYAKEVSIKKLTGRKQEMRFVRLIQDGKISAYLFVPAPSKKLVSSGDDAQNDRATAENQATTYLETEDGRFFSSVEAPLMEIMGDCPAVVEKIRTEAYNFKPLADRPVRKGLTKFVTNAIGDNGLEVKLLEAVREYNTCQ